MFVAEARTTVTGEELEVGMKVRLVRKTNGEVSPRFHNGFFGEVTRLSSWNVYVQFQNGNTSSFDRIRHEQYVWKWEYIPKVIAYKVDQEPLDDEECL